VAGKANSPITVTVFVNDHRAELTVAQYEWPKATLGNPTGDPNLKAAAGIRGLSDLLRYFCDKVLLPAAEDLESLAENREHEVNP
jgi:hypothetical protein